MNYSLMLLSGLALLSASCARYSTTGETTPQANESSSKQTVGKTSGTSDIKKRDILDTANRSTSSQTGATNTEQAKANPKLNWTLYRSARFSGQDPVPKLLEIDPLIAEIQKQNKASTCMTFYTPKGKDLKQSDSAALLAQLNGAVDVATKEGGTASKEFENLCPEQKNYVRVFLEKANDATVGLGADIALEATVILLDPTPETLNLVREKVLIPIKLIQSLNALYLETDIK
jgi:hypothetical protein